MQTLTESIVACKFEASYPASDECVLGTLLDVLVNCVRLKVGSMLSHDSLIGAFQACYRIGVHQSEKGRDSSELLSQASKEAMLEMVFAIFSQIEALPGPAFLSTGHLKQGMSSPMPMMVLSPVPGPPAVAAGKVMMSSQDHDDALEVEVSAVETVVGEVPTKQISGDDMRTPFAETEAEAEGQVPTAEESSASVAAAPELHEIVSVLPAAMSDGRPVSPQAYQERYNLESVNEILLFIVQFISTPYTTGHYNASSHGIDMLCTAVLAAGGHLSQHEILMETVRSDVFRALFIAAAQGGPIGIAWASKAVLALYANVGGDLLLPLEAFIALVLLPAAEGKNDASPETQQAALEAILDFCTQPNFVRDIFVNTDCRIERDNLFEGICGLFSKTSFPVGGSLMPAHVASLDGILAILTALADAPKSNDNGILSGDDGHVSPANKVTYVDIWTALCTGRDPPIAEAAGLPATASRAELARAERLLKAKLSAVAEHFNRDQKKGFQYIQSLGLLPPGENGLVPNVIARFLRSCPGLAKASIGEVLGERESFFDEVRDAFAETFDFTGMEFDMALRLFMDAFRPPGEGQKIDRIMQCFGQRYYAQASSVAGLKSPDAAYVLAFSVIMLNTDLHNNQNKRKMSREDFGRINRNTNEGDPMPPALLNRVYNAIANDELKISSECAAEELPSQTVFWTKLANESHRPRGSMSPSMPPSRALDAEMFALAWSPTLAGVSVILDNAVEEAIIKKALHGLRVAARIAANYGIDDAVESIAISLSRFANAALITPRGSLSYGSSIKAQSAVEALFEIAHHNGDCLRGAWRNIIETLLHMHRLELLPPSVIAVDGEDMARAADRMPKSSMSASKTRGGQGPSLFSRAINSLISMDGADAESVKAAEAEEAASLAAAAASSVQACRIDEIVADTKFLRADSLVELVRAVVSSAGDVTAQVRAYRSGLDTEGAELCIELLITLAMRNRDRVALIWPLLHGVFAAAITGNDTSSSSNAAGMVEVDGETSPLTQRAVLGLLRICHRLLPYKEDTTETLLESLTLILRLPQTSAWILSEQIAAELLSLVRTSASYIKEEEQWKTVCSLIKLTSVRPEAAPLAFECLSKCCRDSSALSAASYMPLLETCLGFIERYKKGNADVAVKLLDLVETLTTWLVFQHNKIPEATLVDLWLTSVTALARGLSIDECQPLRDTAILILHRTLTASEALDLPGELWVQTTRELLTPLVAMLTKYAAIGNTRKSTHPGADKSVQLAVAMLTKVLMQYGQAMSADKEFYDLWGTCLQTLVECMGVKQSEGISESVPENVKNMLLVLATGEVLTPTWTDGSNRNLWELTWSRAAHISSGLTPAMLQAVQARESCGDPAIDEGSEKEIQQGGTDPSEASAAVADEGHRDAGVAAHAILVTEDAEEVTKKDVEGNCRQS